MTCTPDDFVRWARADPRGWAETVFQEHYEDHQVRVMESVRDNVRTTVKACHAPGKTYIAARVALWSLFSWPGSLVITSAPTWRQVRDLLWAELRAAHSKARIPLGGKVRPSMCTLPLGDLGGGQQWGAFGLSTNEGERLQGYHAHRILIILDESSGIRDAIFEAINGISASGDVRILLLSNPTKPYGFFYDSFNRLANLFGGRISISAWDTPNLRALKSACEGVSLNEKLAILRGAPVVHPFLVRASWVADILEGWGEDSDVYRVRVLGDFPRGAPDQLIPLHWVEEAMNAWTNRFDGKTRRTPWWEERHKHAGWPIGALDVARYGDAESVLGAHLDHVVAPMQTWSGLDTVDVAGRVPEHYDRWQLGSLWVDDVGVGGGPYDMLSRSLTCRPFNGAASASDTHYANLRAESYCGLRDLLRAKEVLLPPDPKLLSQLTALRYKYLPNQKLIIESKDDQRARGIPSGDRSDTLMMMCRGARILEMPPSVTAATNSTDWSRMHGD